MLWVADLCRRMHLSDQELRRILWPRGGKDLMLHPLHIDLEYVQAIDSDPLQDLFERAGGHSDRSAARLRYDPRIPGSLAGEELGVRTRPSCYRGVDENDSRISAHVGGEFPVRGWVGLDGDDASGWKPLEEECRGGPDVRAAIDNHSRVTWWLRNLIDPLGEDLLDDQHLRSIGNSEVPDVPPYLDRETNRHPLQTGNAPLQRCDEIRQEKPGAAERRRAKSRKGPRIMKKNRGSVNDAPGRHAH
jgi:hypothetical protein